MYSGLLLFSKFPLSSKMDSALCLLNILNTMHRGAIPQVKVTNFIFNQHWKTSNIMKLMSLKCAEQTTSYFPGVHIGQSSW